MYRGISHEIKLLIKVLLKIAVNDDYVDSAIDAISEVARTAMTAARVRFSFYLLRNVFEFAPVRPVKLKLAEK